MNKLWVAVGGFVSAAFAGLLLMLKLRTKQRNTAQGKAEAAENKAATVVKVKEVQSTINQARHQAAKAAKEVEIENIKNANLPPVGNFGDKRLRNNNKN